MMKRLISVIAVFILTAAVTTNTYAAESIMSSISAGAEKKASVSSDTKMTSVSTDAKKTSVTSDAKKAPVSTDAKKTSVTSDAKKASVSSDAGTKADAEDNKRSDDDRSDDVMKVIEMPEDTDSEDADEEDDDSKAGDDKDKENTEETDSEDEASQSSDVGDLCVANVEDMVNVRAEASEDAKVAGYMYKDCVGEILERGDGWTRIKSGKLEGWTKNDFLLFGDEAEQRIESSVREIAVSNTGALRVRAEASEDSEVKALLAEGDEVDVIDSEDDEWTKISYEDGTSGEDVGYVSNEYISIKVTYKTGETIEEVKDREERSKAAREESARKNGEGKKSESKSDNSGAGAKPTTTNSGSVSASVDDETLLAALIQCECNGPYDAQLAVGAVVVNRAKSGYGSISNAIYAPYQFGPASSGKLAATISSGAISSTARQAARDAISGVSNVGGAKYFRNVKSGHEGIVVGNHVYW